MSKLKIDDIVSVVVETSGVATPRTGFNIGLIVGDSNHITPADRCKVYSSLDAMAEDGFLETDPEYRAALLYFAQTPKPQKVVIGRRNAAESNGETWVQAITDCCNKNGDFYAVYCAGTLTAAEHQAVATYVETKMLAYFMDSSDAADKTNANTGKIGVLYLLSLKRTVAMYSVTAYAGAALMGYAMGANDGTPNSAYTLAYKSLAGVTPDDLSEGEVGYLQGKNANYYITRGDTYMVVEQGKCLNGGWFDELIGIDQLANDMQISCMDVLKNARKVPYTDAGVLRFVLACNGCCDAAVKRGFLAPGVWTEDDVLDVARGDTLPDGYAVQAEPVASQSTDNKKLRVCPPIYACVITAGAIHSVAIKVIVA